MLKNKKIRVVVVVIHSLFLIGGASMASIKGIDHLRIEKQRRQKNESIKESKKEVKDQAKARQKIALWVVQHYEGPEPIKKIEVGKIYTYGIMGSGGQSSSAVINGNYKNVIESISVDSDGNPTGDFVYDTKLIFKFNNKADTSKNLENVEVGYWEGRK